MNAEAPLPPSRQRLLAHATELDEAGKRDAAIALLRNALALQPQQPELWFQLAWLQKQGGHAHAALTAFGHAIEHGIARPEEVHLHRAILLTDHLRRDDEARDELHAALRLAPDYVPALLNLGNLHEEHGQREEAVACYRRLLDAPGTDPRQAELRPEALSRWVSMAPPQDADDPRLQRLQAAVTQPAPLEVRANLYYALGRVHDRLGDVDAAFDAWAKANRHLMRGGGQRWSRQWISALVDGIIEAFPDAPAPAPAPARPQPLFVCGLFRSGSTLIEQVLGSHPQVTAGGELPWLLRAASTEFAPWPASMRTPDPTREACLAEGYRDYLRGLFAHAFDGDVHYITDKRPDNFLLIGLLQRLFPGVRIVHTRRHPLDTGLSMFMHHLNPSVAGYALDLGDIGHYYGEYQRLMAHWHRLYPQSIFDFDYDRFVHAPEPQLRALLDFLDLSWDARCLDFHRHGGAVKTASYWQIREPLNTRGCGRWRRYRSKMEPMARELRAAGVEFDDA